MLTNTDKCELDYLSKELNIRQLRQQAKLDKKENLKQLRAEFKQMLDDSIKKKSIDFFTIDKEMIGFRERVAARYYANGLTFKSHELIVDKEQVKIVNRPNTHIALAQLNQDVKKSPHDEIAAQIFLQNILYFTAKGIKEDELYPSLWPIIYEEILHRTSLLNAPLVTTHAIHGVLEPKSMINFSFILPTAIEKEKIDKDHTKIVENSFVPELEVNAHWYTITDGDAAGGDSSVSKLGTFAILDHIQEINFPVVNAKNVSKELLARYELSLHDPSEKLYYPDQTTLYAAEYEFSQNYLKDYILEEKLGRGLPIHRQNFTHYFIPMAPNCQGGFIVGRQINIDKWCFIAIEVPYGTVLQINPNVAYSNAFCQGRYTIVSNSVKKEENTAFFKKRDGSIQLVNQSKVVKDDILNDDQDFCFNLV